MVGTFTFQHPKMNRKAFLVAADYVHLA